LIVVQPDGVAGHSFYVSIVGIVGGVRGRRAVVPDAIARLSGGDAHADRVSRPDVGDVDERFVHEDDGDQYGEALLGEPSDVADECAHVQRDGHEQKQRYPDADPQTKRQKVYTVLSM